MMNESQLEPRVIRIEEHSPVLTFVIWSLGFGAVVWFTLTRVSPEGWSQTIWLSAATVVILWIWLTERGLVVDLDQIREQVVRHRIGLWGTKYDDEIREIPFRDIAQVEIKQTWHWFGRSNSVDFRVRLRLRNGETIEITRPVMSLVASSRKATAVAEAIGLVQPPVPVD